MITTDGLENASHEYSYQKIQEMIARHRDKDHWEFIFLGANMDAVAEARRFGIHEDRAVTFENDSEGIEINYRVLSDAVCQMRESDFAADAAIDKDWKTPITDYWKKKQEKKQKK